MRLPVDGMQAFVKIAELGSFNKAAEQLFITQTGLTRRMQRLEAFIGMPLLDRTTRTTSLTATGRQFLPLARRLVEDLTQGLDQLRQQSRMALGDVTMAVLQSVAYRQLPAVLQDYALRHPHNRVQLLERSGALVTEAVRQGQAEFGIHIQQDDQPDLLEHLLSRDPFKLVCHPDHPLAAAATVRWQDLHAIDLITLGGASGNRRVVEQQLERVGLPARGRFVAESTPSAIALAAAGAGAAILPAAAIPGPAMAAIREVPLVDPVLFRTIALVRRRRETLTPAAEALYAMIRAAMGVAAPG